MEFFALEKSLHTSQVCPVVVKLNLAGVCWLVCSIWAQWIVCMKNGPIDWAATNATHIMLVWRNSTANNPENYMVFILYFVPKSVFQEYQYYQSFISYQWSLQTSLFYLNVDNTSKETWMLIQYQCNIENWRSRIKETRPCWMLTVYIEPHCSTEIYKGKY